MWFLHDFFMSGISVCLCVGPLLYRQNHKPILIAFSQNDLLIQRI